MILGRFCFRQTNNGNLIGEFSNNTMRLNISESADIISPIQGPFLGIFNSTWFEEVATSLRLVIQSKQNSNNRIFSLEWQDENHEPIYFGEGFIFDDILIGNYWDAEIQNQIGNLL
ncbi:hypothetical protein HPE56_08150 [Maribacter sp. ANRC-HE7]|uniref:Uncharacterized protein n=1 Tax=Maribacter aquimaris TaxID=2737171 RepID=A0ABR7UYT1_9FLAO|nr:hypothetical protein [Maribacter aquimaris]MBD0777762.1 hypothetical protein [Maribacter aquimaris]